MYAKFVAGRSVGGRENCDMLETIQNLIGLLKNISLTMSCQLNIYNLFDSTEDGTPNCLKCTNL